MNPEELKAQLAQLEQQLKTAATAEAKAAIEAQKKDIEAKLEAATKDVPALRKELDEAKATIVVMKDAADKNQKALDELLAKQKDDKGGPKTKSFNNLLAEALDEKKELFGDLKAKKIKSTGLIDLKAAGDMSFSANASTLDVSITTLRPGIITLPQRKLHIRELLPGGSMSTSNYTFLREKTTGEGNPATVSEGNWKEQLDIDLEEIDSPSQYIAGYLVASTKMLDDIPAFISFLQMRLLEKYLRSEDVQLLYGDGNSPNLGGITKAGNFTAASGFSAVNDVEQLIFSISQLETLDREANGILVNPSDYYIMMTYKASTSGEYTSPMFGLVTVLNGQLYISGVPVFKSTAIGKGFYIVGDWTNGAAIITREAPRVEIFYEDGYNVRRNQVTVRVEGRIAFPIFGSDYFIYGALGLS